MDPQVALYQQYGPLLTYAQLAKLLDRSVPGLKASMSKKDSDVSRLLSPTKLRIGGRVYFQTAQVAALLAASTAASGGAGPEGSR